MKIGVFVVVMAGLAITSGVFVPPRHAKKKVTLLGSDHCTWGPTHWCRNLTNAAECHATRHCIDTVWTHMTLPIDNSSVCQICLDMVKQARDQLESNETQELIKEVFEGTCALIHLKPIVQECDKIADEYIPDLIETLASEMNPQVVCSVAGLCNSDKVHKLLAEQAANTEKTSVESAIRDTCQDCHTVVGLIEQKFSKLTRDEVLQNLLVICGRMGSFSDGCSNIVVTYFEEIYTHLQDHLNPNEVCLMSGECSAKFHKHNTANVEITPMSHVGYVPVNKDKEEDDLPCALCEQLVGHLRDLLIANTTQEEFEMVLQGLCRQTGKFSSECLSLVNQYYSQIYNYLVNELNSSEVCTLMGICHPSADKGSLIAPLLPAKSAKLALSLSQPEDKPLVHIKIQSDKATLLPPLLLPPGLIQEQQQPQQLPIDLLMPPHTQVLYNRQICQFCEYFLHFVQEEITEPATEEKIKDVIDKACTKLPDSINATCIEFVDTYEPALIALLAQDLDPSQICPLIKACPSADSKDVEIFMQAKGDSKCPLCLFTVTKLESIVKDKKTKESIKDALDKVCLHLPGNMNEECQDFVKTYSDELVEMLIADLKPEEVCVYLKLCSDHKPSKQLPPYVYKHVGGNIETNVIPDNTINGKIIDSAESSLEDSPQCVLCEFVMKEIEDELQDKTTDDNIKRIVRNICNIMPPSVKKQCNDFVEEYGDAVIQLLIETLKPNEICPMLKLCNSQFLRTMHVEILECPICQLTVEAMEKILANPKIDHEVEHVLEKTCRGVSVQYRDKCQSIVETYGDTISTEYDNQQTVDQICVKIGLCRSPFQTLVGANRCTYGPGYWCQSERNADECGARSYCMSNVWNPPRTKRQIPGSEPCSYGPSYWCKNQENADKCQSRSYCESKVWNISRTKRQLVGGDPCTYGPSYWCLNKENADKCEAKSYCESKVWNKMKTKRELIGANPCTFGPSYWCQNQANADKCESRSYCESKVWNISRAKRQLVGGDPCTYGPSYWCENKENADKCGAKSYCESKVWNKVKTKRELIGANPCTFGPSYWCENVENADKCQSRTYCESKVWNPTRTKRQIPGSDPCSYGPSYWCKNQENADKCQSRSYCESNVWNISRTKRQLVGGDPCTYGPSYWCENKENADKCGAKSFCESKVWNKVKTKREVIGANPCTFGPSYWCENIENADKCQSRPYCESRVWNISRTKRQLVGGDSCTYGPSYWCEKKENADKCGAKSYCESKVWNKVKTKRELIGANPCTFGPSYWCQNKENADKCQVRSYCETKVWGKI